MSLLFASPGDGGMLIHCISGWDKTPLYISLLRLSLWAVSYSSRRRCSLALGSLSPTPRIFCATPRKYLHSMRAVLEQL